MKRLSIFLLLPLVLVLTACTLSPLVVSLDAIEAATIAAEAGIPVAVSSGVISATIGSEAMKLAQDASTATTAAIAEAETTDSAATMATKIAADYSPVLRDVPGLPAVVQPLVSGVISAIQGLIATLNPPTPAAKATLSQTPIKLSGSDRSKLAQINTKAQQSATVAREYIAKNHLPVAK